MAVEAAAAGVEEVKCAVIMRREDEVAEVEASEEDAAVVAWARRVMEAVMVEGTRPWRQMMAAMLMAMDTGQVIRPTGKANHAVEVKGAAHPEAGVAPEGEVVPTERFKTFHFNPRVHNR